MVFLAGGVFLVPPPAAAAAPAVTAIATTNAMQAIKTIFKTCFHMGMAMKHGEKARAN